MNQGDAAPVAGPNNNTIGVVPDNVTLRIVILAHGNAREDDLYLVLSLDTTLGALKRRIQESLAERPAPEQQRIIYQGRGLDDVNESLRNILRHDQRVGNSSYVLHLVVRQVPVGPAAAASTSLAQQTPTNTPLHSRQTQVQTQQGLPGQPTRDDHMRIHNQIHLMQHALQHQQAINRELHRAGHGQWPSPTLARPDQTRQQQQIAGPANSVDRSQATNQGHTPPQNAAAPIQIPDPWPTQAHFNPTNTNAIQPGLPIPGMNNLHAHHVQAAQAGPGSLPHPMTNTTQVRTAIDSNGQQTRTIINGPTSTTTMTFRITGLNPPNPLDRPSSAPGSSPSADAEPTNRVINPMPGNVQIQAQPPPVPLGFPFQPGTHLPLPMNSMVPNVNNPVRQLPVNNPSSQPMAWLLSSPTGPQGIVFAPGHGFFNTSSEGTLLPQSTPTVPSALQQAQAMARSSSGVVAHRAPEPGARPEPPPALGLPARLAARAPPRAENNQNDIFQLLINRGWLFLRLYMFVFVFSESGTWRRILLIGAIIVYCCLPQQNPLTTGLQVVRRHFDNLIGPPNIPQRQAQRPQPGNENAAQTETAQSTQSQPGTTSARRRAAQVPSPEETARRLLERQNRRNPNPIIDAFHRFEQGAVLFLASLVPGVGERHVRAREEARRIVQDEEDEHRRLAETQQQDESGANQEDHSQSERSQPQSEAQRGEVEDGPLPDDWKTAAERRDEASGGQATSSGIDRLGQTEAEGLRPRGTNSEGS